MNKFLPPLPNLRELLRIYKLKALKHLSQNFLLDSKLTDKIVKAAGGMKYLQDSHVVEVGPGPGPITRSILNSGVAKLTVIEKDERFIPTLKLIADAVPGKMDIIIGDILTYDMSTTFCDNLQTDWYSNLASFHIIGNLPFNISTPLIIKWIHDISERRNAWNYGRTRMTLTFQQEVAERIVAREGDSQRCRLSIICQNWCHVSHKFTIPGSAFIPKPDVNVGVVHLLPRKEPLIPVPFVVLEKFCRNLFSYRQKYSRRGLSTLFPVSLREEWTNELLQKAEINGELRPFQLHIEEISRLAVCYWEMCKNEPGLFEYDYRAPVIERKESDWVVNNKLFT